MFCTTSSIHPSIHCIQHFYCTMSQNSYIYPCFSPPRCTPPPPHTFPPPPPHSVPPPPPHGIPPPPPPPHGIPTPPPPSPILTPPPPHPVAPPPPSIVPTPPSPPSGNNTVIIVVFVSLGGLFFLAFLAVALCCFIKKKKKKMVQETEVVDIDEHIKVQEAIVPGPRGPHAVILSVEDDIQIHEDIKKNEIVGQGHRTKSTHSPPQTLEAGPSHSNRHFLEHKP
ncbi:protein TRACHEARY ELEMENT DIFFERENTIATION-RELATED 7A [Magnolia sinica]|uniref:protein TRACHEARY ELEMENT DIFFERENTIATION-RELATED 7A n=1 Tax=Magnolia sinica TaxID=86752 RepID=UPI0026591301|nr:protein TRACHEARY ELEMENT DIFFERENTIATION-RELATED 7A [Magnolia sinica]